MRQPRVAGGLRFQRHLTALAFEKVGDVFQGLARAVARGARR